MVYCVPMSSEARIGQHPEGLILRPNEAVLTTKNQVSAFARLNPLRHILNPVAYKAQFGVHGEKFSPGEFEPIRVVWVQVSPTRKELLVQDGNHRLAAIEDNYDDVKAKDPKFDVILRNVTHVFLEQGAAVDTSDDPAPFTF